MLTLVIYVVGDGSVKIFSFEALTFFTGTSWNSVPGRESFGALPYTIEALASSAVAMVVGVPVSLGIAIIGSEMSSPKKSTTLSIVIELLAAVRSIIYGLWALMVFRFWSLGLIKMSLYKAFGRINSMFL